MDIKNEVLRYLGYKDQVLAPELSHTIDWCIDEIRKISKPKSIDKRFKITKTADGIIPENSTVVLSGESIREHLKYSGEIVLFAATLGIQADNLIRFYTSADITKAVILDACATQYLEEYCDALENDIKRRDKFITWRFSPGYGDLPIELQPDIIRVLEADKKIGLTCTENYIMIPRKSVTAIIGITDSGGGGKGTGCEICGRRSSCKFRKE